MLVRQIILPTLITAFVSSVTFSIIYLIKGDFVYSPLYVGILTFGNILIPTLIAIILFRLLYNKTKLHNNLATKAFQAIVLSLIFVAGLYTLAILDILFLDIGELTLVNINNDFNSQFVGFLPIAFCEALIIPFVYSLLNKQRTDKGDN